MKKQDTFVSRKGRKIKTFKYKLVSRVRTWLANRMAPVTDHKDFPRIRDLIINIVFTGLVITYILWAFRVLNPLRKGLSIAVILAMIQYYYKWYRSIK